MRKLNEKAFNLFTALVAFILIILAIVLVNNMTMTEVEIVNTINDIETQVQMQAVADIIRADTLHYIEYTTRQKIEDYFNKNPLPINMEDDWKDVVAGYVLGIVVFFLLALL